MAVEKELKKEKSERKKGGFFVFYSRQAEGPAGGAGRKPQSFKSTVLRLAAFINGFYAISHRAFPVIS